MIDFSLENLQAQVMDSLVAVHHPRLVNIVCALGTLYVVLEVVRVVRRKLKTTALRGPPNPSYIWGVDENVLTSPDSGAEYEKWAEEYGGVYEVPCAMGGRKIILCDPKAIAHCYGATPYTYILTPFGEIATHNVIGKGMFTAKGESHRRQRKTLTPAFTNAAIRGLTSVFYDSAYKAEGIWGSLIESNGGSAVIEVQSWMNHISLDTIGISCFSHDFGTLDGKQTSVTEVFDAFRDGGKFRHISLRLLSQAFPWLLRVPTPLTKLGKRMNDTMGGIANALLAQSRKEKGEGIVGEREEKSILGLLIRAENQGNQRHLTCEEVMAQARGLLVAGFETTSISLTWALIELSKRPDIQDKLRTELLEFGADPTYDQLSTNLPYLDAVVHETLRLHPPIHDTNRMAAVDDVIPLSNPVRTRSGKLVDHICVAKGTHVSVPILSMNRSTMVWGPDAKEFKPERWIGEQGIPAMAKEMQGHRHLLTFTDGPRICIGKGFAIAEFKVVLSILVKHFVFEFPGGPETAIKLASGFLPRPKVVGEEGTAVPLCVRRFE